MEDLADALKRQYLGLYKKKSDIFGTVQNRMDKMQRERKTNRRQEMFEKRNIPVDMSPVVTPMPKRPKGAPKPIEQPKQQPPSTNKRLEMLQKWKVDKERRLATEKKNSKPLFKVCHIPVKVGLPNLENVNKEIKGKSFKSKFAPQNHQFKPPANVKPIPMNSTNTQPPQHRKNTEVAAVRHRMVTRSQNVPSAAGIQGVEKNSAKKVTKAKPEEKKGATKEVIKSKREVANRTIETKKNAKVKVGGKKELKEIKEVKNKRDQEIVTTTIQKNEDLAMSPDFPVQAIINSESDDDANTPKKTQPPAYVSPFVTMSRGKNSARKEYEARRSGQSFSAKKGDLDCTSPVAGAAYFRRLLSTHTLRLRELSEQWNKYKDEESPPEEAVSMIDVTVGQTTLLLTKKFMQFKGLISQCEDASCNTTVKCDDLHGFWDMMYIQVNNLDKRFENLTNLKGNNWQEILPVVAKPAVQKKGKSVQNAKASAGLKAAIQAARRKRENDVMRTPKNRRSSHRLESMKSEEKSRKSGSPGLMMMKVAQYAKTVETPGKSILKSDICKSAKSQTKTVLFRDEIDEDGDAENDLNQSNVRAKVNTPTRRSTRLSKSQLF